MELRVTLLAPRTSRWRLDLWTFCHVEMGCVVRASEEHATCGPIGPGQVLGPLVSHGSGTIYQTVFSP
jgi:hypothetical protein